MPLRALDANPVEVLDDGPGQIDVGLEIDLPLVIECDPGGRERDLRRDDGARERQPQGIEIGEQEDHGERKKLNTGFPVSREPESSEASASPAQPDY